MKKLYTLIFILILVLPAFSQHTKGHRNVLTSNPSVSALDGPVQSAARRHMQIKNALAIMQKLDSQEFQDYDVVNSRWANSDFAEYSYDNSGYNTRDTYFSWDSDTEIYELDAKQESVNNNGILTEQVYYDWDDYTSTWEQSVKFTYSYDDAGNRVLAYTSFFDDPDWSLFGRSEYTYNGSGNMVLRISSYWDEDEAEWINQSRMENSYSSGGLLIVSTAFDWDYFTEDWVNDYKDEYTYNGAGHLLMIISYEWDEGSSEWKNETKDEYTYDNNMNLVMILQQEWSGGQWLNEYKTEMSYNNSYAFNQLILPWMYMENWGQIIGHMPVELVVSEYIGSSFVLSYRELFNYSEINITGVPVIQPDRAGLYPQPADDYVTFEWESNNPTFNLSLYNVNGKLVMESMVTNNKSVSIDHLASGLYFYRLTDNAQNSISGKLSVR